MDNQEVEFMSNCVIVGRPKGDKPDEVAHLRARMPKDLHTEFKLWCVKNNRTMDTVICELVQEFLDKQHSQG